MCQFFWRKRTESNPQGATNARLFSRQVPSPVGLRFHKYFMFTAIAFILALNVDQLPLATLEKYYWDCDTIFMKGEMGGQDIMSCLAITDQFILKKFKNNKKK